MGLGGLRNPRDATSGVHRPPPPPPTSPFPTSRTSPTSSRTSPTSSRPAPWRTPAVDPARPYSDPDALESLFASRSFTCTQCGKCCTGQGEVWVEAGEEIDAMASHLGISRSIFLDQYCKNYTKIDGWRLLKQRTGTSGDCIFLEDNLCTLHEARPLQCRTYPWWPELLPDQAWREERDLVCEGMDHEDAEPTNFHRAVGDLIESQRYFARRDAARERALERRSGTSEKGEGRGDKEEEL